MYEHFLLNLSLLAIFTFVGIQLLIHPYVKNISSKASAILIGLYMGISGIILYKLGITTSEGSILSLRSIAILVAIHFGGASAGVISLITMSIPDMWSLSTWLRAVLVLGTIGASGYIITRKYSCFKRRWLWMSGSTLAIFILSGGLDRTDEMVNFNTSIPYLITAWLGVLFIGFLIRYLHRATEVQEQLKETRDELTNTMRLHNGITFKIIKQDTHYVYKMISGKLLSRLVETLGGGEISDYEPGLKVFSLLPSASGAKFRGHIDSVWNGGMSTGYETRVGKFDLWVTLQPILEDEAVTSIIGTIIDISEQKAAERRIHESEERYLSLAENPQDFILELDRSGSILFANSYFCNMARKDQREVVGRPLFELGMKMNESQWRKNWIEIAATGRKTGFETTIIMADGVTREYYVILSDIQGTSEVEGYMICSMHEITDLKQADQESRAKSRFLARVSHEIRTPLNGIIGLAQLMKHTELSDIQQDYMHKITSSSHLLLGIINDILDLSKIEAGKLNMEQVEFDIDELVYDLTNTLSVLKGFKQVEVVVETDTHLPARLLGDPLRLKQILMNLCSNAIKFTEQGYVHLYVQQLQQTRQMISIRFTVEDTGIGMTGEQLRMLYEPFWQAEYDSGGKQSGTGLGLPIVKELVSLLGGELRASSQIGIGSRFQFEIDMPIPESEDRTWELEAPDGRFRVHIVEDDRLHRDVIARTLESFGCRVTTSQTWDHLYQFVDRASRVSEYMDCIVVDMEMDDMYGEHTWTRLMELCNRKGIAVIALASAYAREEIMQMMGGQLPNALLSKPTSRLELYQTLKRIVVHNGHASTIALQSSSREAAVSTEQDHAASQPSILLVEDNEINQQVAVELLRLFGYEVTVANHGLEALERLNEQRFDLILMDMYMPILNGYETTKRIRASAEHSDIPIIALTANAMQSDHKSYYEIGINDIMLKPLDAEMLRKCVNHWMPSPHIRHVSRRPEERALYEAIRETIVGVDLDQMLKRLEGKVSIALHILHLFKKEYTDFAERLTHLLGNGEYRDAAREVHTLIGVAKNMSAHRLAVAAIQLEAVVIDNPTAYFGALETASAEIAVIIQSLPDPSLLEMNRK
ncbi:PAS domain S-box-containing protein [Paenibacillus cellulosilyticus]|uniref:Circadian input-output histidine kinase CikA n=1 Tax=Paenibacillus cellulosilyticus TaxID=375489 RepID=A0A2V2YXP4_9BACL|nr:response regulator [Paenibacillus cellulosilyticus]PWW07114.1 PAS domain S-box-containing protein [Paenibacillus cellulosilyticus]QKS44672.1 response regulator [Paenibacillus cellulosilyticus]